MIRRTLVLISLAVPATAGDFSLLPPIACDLETDCYIQQYVDHDPTEGVSDYRCGGLSYDTHKGTDFAVPDLARMRTGVDVLAAAGGTVTGLRDGMPDVGYSADTGQQIKGRECGNGIVLKHEDGWETQYCHLKQGSIKVARGQVVEPGQILGEVGMSGRAQFPHVHLSVRRNGNVVDPFDPTGVLSCADPGQDTLWAAPPPFRPGGIISAGITDKVPGFDAIRGGTATSSKPGSSAEALVVFGYFFGIRKDDIVHLTLTGPSGEIVEERISLKKSQALAFRAAGRKRRTRPWPPGAYEGQIALTRAEEVIDIRTVSLLIP